MTRAMQLWTAAALLATAPAVSENVYLPEEPGKTTVIVEKGAVGQHKLKPDEAARYVQNLTRIRDLLVARPMLQHLVGMSVKGYFRINDNPGKPGLPAPGFAFLRYHPMMKDWHTGKPVAFIVSTWSIRVGINDPVAGLALMNTFERPLYMAPAPMGEIDGVPVYTVSQGNHLMVFTQNGRLPWIPVTGAEYADLVVSHWKRLAAEPLTAAAMQPFVTRFEAWRAAMTPEARKAQAWQNMEYLPGEVEKGPALVKPDPAWFDPALPRSAFQVVTLIFDYGGDLDLRNPKATRNPAPLRVWETLHTSPWKDLRGVVTTR